MKFRLNCLAVLGVLFAVGAAGAEDDGGEDESTKTFDAGYNAASGAQDSNASVSYTVLLSDNLKFSTSTSLGNGAKAEDNSVSRDRDTNLSIEYDPPSPWRLNVAYTNVHNLYHRPPSITYDEFKTDTSNNGVGSTLNYDFTENLKTNMNLGVNDSYQKTIIVMGNAPPPSSSLTHTFGGGVDYNLTAATAMGADYSGDIASSEIDVAKMGTWPPVETKPLRSRKKTNTLSGSLTSNKDVTDTLNVNASVNASDGVGRDNLLPAMDSDGLNGSATGAVTWNPVSAFSASNTASVGRDRTKLLNKDQYFIAFDEIAFDSYNSSFQNATELTVTPSDRSKMKSTFTYAESQNLRLDDNGQYPDRTQIEAGNYCLTTAEGTLVSNVDLALGQDITFHLTHYLRESRPHYIVFPYKDFTARTNNLDGNIGFDWTESLRVDVATAMQLTLNRYANALTALNSDADDLNVTLNTTFTYDLTRATELVVGTDIGKSSLVHTYPGTTAADSANINRHFSTTARHEFGEVFKPSLAFDMSFSNQYYPGNRSSNRRDRIWSLSPVAQVNTSDNLTLSFSFFYSDYESDAMYNPLPENWERRQSFNSSVGVTYTLAQNLTATLSSSDSHSVVTKDRIRKAKDLPAESFFNVAAGLNFTF